MAGNRQRAAHDKPVWSRHRTRRLRGIGAATLRRGACGVLHLTINGEECATREGATILEALRSVGAEVPTLCHDVRLQPNSACRLCVVEVKGWDRHAPACTTPVLEGM